MPCQILAANCCFLLCWRVKYKELSRNSSLRATVYKEQLVECASLHRYCLWENGLLWSFKLLLLESKLASDISH